MGRSDGSGRRPSSSPAKPARGKGLRRRALLAALLMAGPVSVSMGGSVPGGRPALAAAPASSQHLLDALARSGDAATAEALVRRLRRLWREAAGPAARRRLEDAEAALAARDVATAGQLLAALLAERPDYAAAWQAKAVLHWQTGDLALSLAALGQVLALEPRQFDALYLQGVDLLGLGRSEEAAQAFAAVLAVDPFHAPARAQLLRLIGKDGALRRDL